MFSLVSRTTSAPLIVTSNKPFSGWGEIFGDDVVAAAMIDRLVHHASREGSSPPWERRSELPQRSGVRA